LMIFMIDAAAAAAAFAAIDSPPSFLDASFLRLRDFLMPRFADTLMLLMVSGFRRFLPPTPW